MDKSLEMASISRMKRRIEIIVSITFHLNKVLIGLVEILDAREALENIPIQLGLARLLTW